MASNFDKAMADYYNKFGKSFPTEEMIDCGEDKCIALAKKCIRKNKTVEEMGYKIKNYSWM